MALVLAEGRRQDEIREASEQRLDDLRRMNDDHLRELINVRADANEKMINVRADYEEKLRVAAERQAEALAGQVSTVAETFRAALDAQFSLVNKAIAELRENQSATAGRSSGLGQGWQYLIGGVGLLLSLITIASTAIIIVTR